jgi:hypothetical protein
MLKYFEYLMFVILMTAYRHIFRDIAQARKWMLLHGLATLESWLVGFMTVSRLELSVGTAPVFAVFSSAFALDL